MTRKRLVALALSTAVLASTASSLAPAYAVSNSAAATEAGPQDVPATLQNEMPAGGVFSPGSAWRVDVTKAPLNANSSAMVANVADQTAKYYGGVAAFNAYQYSTSFYTVPADQPRVDVKWNNCQNKNYTPASLLGEGGQFSQVPIPADAVPAKGTDAQLTIYSPSTDQLWEFWVTSKVNGAWTACWGGRIDEVSKSDGQFPGTYGASASGLALAGGTIGIKDVEAGVIDHAIALHLPAPGRSDEFSYPAQRSDGFDTSAARVPEGTRLRLDASVDVDKLNLTPIAKMVAKAAQKYGFIVTDRSGCTAVLAESPEAAIRTSGVDPWKALMGSTPDYALLKNFPWSSLQALPKDWGKPTGNTDPTVKYVSDTAYRTVTNGWGPVEKDRSNNDIAAGDGRTLSIGGLQFAKGLGVHAPSEVVVPTSGATKFTAKVGVDDEAGSYGSATFQVWNGTTKLADTGLIRQGQAARTLSVDVTGMTEIRLVVTDGGDGNSGDHADWADAKLITPLPTSTPTSTSSPTTTNSTPSPTTTNPTPSPSTTTPAPTPSTVSTWASDTTYRVVSNGWGPIGVDQSNGEQNARDGRPLSVAGQTFTKGFGVHAASEVIVPVSGATRFTASVGVDDEILPRGSVVFQVWNGSTKLADTGLVKAGQTARKLSVDVTGMSEIRLVVTDGGDGNSADHADWGNAQLTAPAPTPTPTTTAASTSTPSASASASPSTPSGTPTTAPASTKPVPSLSTTDGSAGGSKVTTSSGVPTTAPSTTTSSAPAPVAVSSLPFRTVRNGWGPVEKDRSVGGLAAGDGTPLLIGGKAFATGLGVHAASEVVVPVGGRTTFTASVGVDSVVGRQGSVVFQVWNGTTKIADSGVLRGGAAAKQLTVDVSGMQEIRLVVTDAGDGNSWDHADWAGATLS